MQTSALKQSSYWSRRVTPGKVLIYLALLVIFFITFYPFFYVLSLAVMPYDKFVSMSVHAWPNGFTLMYFQQILQDPNLPHGYLISIARTLIGGSLNVVATCLAGYALSRKSLKYRGILTFLFLIPMYFSAGIIPYYLAIRATGLANTFWVLILRAGRPHVAVHQPGFFLTVPGGDYRGGDHRWRRPVPHLLEYRLADFPPARRHPGGYVWHRPME